MKANKNKDVILKYIIDEYISSSKPVGSVYLIEKYKLNISSATVRNIMALLEKENLIEKSHTSSGRIPTSKGYEYYAKNLIKDENDEEILIKIKHIFEQRKLSIDIIIDEAVSIISEASKMTVITSEEQIEERLKSLTLTPINECVAIIVLITSSGRVDSKELRLSKNLNLNDLKIAIRIFQERLQNTKLIDISHSIELLKPILKKHIKNYEELIETLVTNIFVSYKNISKNKVFGKQHLIKSSDIKRQELANIIELIENQSIWESIDNKNHLEDNLKLEILPSNTSIFSKRLTIKNKVKDISVVGPKRMDYSKAKNILNIIERYTKEILENKEDED